MNEASMTGEAAQAGLSEGGGRAQDVYERLRDDLLALRLVPGERLSERNLERRLGASRTPIREALMRLEAEGLVQRGEGGLRVAPLDLDELLEVFELRIETEALAVRLACTRADHARLDALQARMDGVLADPSPDAWYAIGTDYHIELAALSGNRFVHRSVRDAVTRIARARWLMASSEAGALRRPSRAQRHRGDDPRQPPRRGRGGDSRPYRHRARQPRCRHARGASRLEGAWRADGGIGTTLIPRAA